MDVLLQRLPLKMAFCQANYRTQQSESVILEIQTRNGITAFGEANPLGFVNGERTRIHMSSTLQQDGGMLRVYRISVGQQDMNKGADYPTRDEVIAEHQFEGS